MPIFLRQLYAYRSFVMQAVINDFRFRFVRSKVAGLWVIAQPLVQVAIFALILSNVLGAKLAGVDGTFAYSIHLLAGMLIWTLFLDSVTRLATCFVEHGNAIKKIAFPRICPPAIAACIAIASFLLFLLIALAFTFAIYRAPTWASLHMLPVIAITLMLGVGFGLVVGTLNVFMRDVWQVVNVILQFAFWLTPVVYPAQVLSPTLQSILVFNPLYAVVTGMQEILIRGVMPDYVGLLYPAVLGAALLVLGFVLFRRAAPDMADVL